MTDVIAEMMPLKVHITGADVPLVDKPKVPCPLRVSHKTINVVPNTPYNLASYDPLREEIHLNVLSGLVVVTSSTGQASDSANNVASTPTAPGVPATGVAAQNVNSYPVQVVIGANGATITNVSINGVTVGTAAGTYVVPAYGSISMAYTVATPTWAWTGIGVTSTPNVPNGRLLGPSNGSEYVIPGPDETWLAAPVAAQVAITVVRSTNR